MKVSINPVYHASYSHNPTIKKIAGLAQPAQMWVPAVIIGAELGNDVPQVRRAENDEMIKAFSLVRLARLAARGSRHTSGEASLAPDRACLRAHA